MSLKLFMTIKWFSSHNILRVLHRAQRHFLHFLFSRFFLQFLIEIFQKCKFYHFCKSSQSREFSSKQFPPHIICLSLETEETRWKVRNKVFFSRNRKLLSHHNNIRNAKKIREKLNWMQFFLVISNFPHRQFFQFFFFSVSWNVQREKFQPQNFMLTINFLPKMM